MYKVSCNIVFFLLVSHLAVRTKKKKNQKIPHFIAYTAQANQHEIRIAFSERDYLFHCHPTMNIIKLWGKRR